MNRVENRFRELKKKNQRALITYVTAGFPSLKYTQDLMEILEESGADIIELGVPFSDPIADGPTIQRASEGALKNGVSLKNVLELVKNMRKGTDIPVVLMGYYNPFFAYGIEKFTEDAVKSGVDGLIVPDLPPEEAENLIKYARRQDIATIFLVAPTSTEGRMRVISECARGFLYYVSLTGVTGSRKVLPDGIEENVRRIKRLTELPVCVGFGVSMPEQAKMLSKFADGVVVGSAIIKIILEKEGKRETLVKISDFVKTLKKAMG